MYHRSQRGSERPYFLMERATAQDKDLSIEALGLLTYLLSKPDTWLPSATDLAKRSNWCKPKVYKVLNELLERGYLVRRQERVNGRVTRWVMDVFETPVLLSRKLEVEKLEVEKLEVEKLEVEKLEIEKLEIEKRPTREKRVQIKQKTQIKQNTHTTEAPAGAGGVVSIHSLAICQQYAQHLHDSGQGISNPGGFARALYNGTLAGQYDAAITAWLAAPAQPKYKKLHDDPQCPRCQGYGWEYVGGDIGMRRCAAGA